MPIPAQDIIRDAATILVDETGVRFPAGELVRWLNAAQLALAEKRPDAYTKSAAVALVVGVQQALPAEALKLIDIKANASGAPVRHVDRVGIDAALPSWRQSTGVTTIRNWMHDPRDPLVFEVYPPAALGASLQVVYAVTPTPVAAPSGDQFDDVTGDVAVSASFKNALLDAVLYRAFSKDAEHPANNARSMAHYEAFLRAIGEELQTTAVVRPKAGKPGEAS
jgi:hypothetical protein